MQRNNYRIETSIETDLVKWALNENTWASLILTMDNQGKMRIFINGRIVSR